MSNESTYRNEIIEVGKRLYLKDFVASNDGNISIRIADDEILITPTGVSKGQMTADQLLKVDRTGKVITGFMKPTSEMKMHLAVYRCRGDVKAIVHAHPPTATGFAVSGYTFDKVTLPEVIFNLGRIELSEYGTPTTDQVPRTVEKKIRSCDVLLLANHGALTVGKDVMEAYYRMETLEAVAKITLVTRILGRENVLSDSQTQELYDIKAKSIPKTISCTHCGKCGLSS